MSLQNAINYISKINSDSDFSKSCNAFKLQTELLAKHKSLQMNFTPKQTEVGFNMFEIKHQTCKQAGRVKKLNTWFRLFKLNYEQIVKNNDFSLA